MLSPMLCIIGEFRLELDSGPHNLEKMLRANSSELAGRVWRRREIGSAEAITYL